MSRKQKRDKPYRPKEVRIRLGITKKDLDGMHEIIDKCSLIATMKLPKGLAVDEDMHWIQDCLMWTRVSLHERKKKGEHFDEEGLKQFLEILNEGHIAYAETVARFRGYTTNAYTPRAEELKAIVDAVALCRDYLRDRAERCPSALLYEWDSMSKQKKRAKPDYRQKLK